MKQVLRRVGAVAFVAGVLFMAAPIAGATDDLPPLGTVTGTILGGAFSHVPAYDNGYGGFVGGPTGRTMGDLAAISIWTGLIPSPATGMLFAQPLGAAPTAIDTSDCRPYRDKITLDGKEQVVAVTACKQPNGTWRVVP